MPSAPILPWPILRTLYGFFMIIFMMPTLSVRPSKKRSGSDSGAARAPIGAHKTEAPARARRINSLPIAREMSRSLL